MLVVDPMKRITIPEIRQHQWFTHKLPAYLSVPPNVIDQQERHIDEEIVEQVANLPFPEGTESVTIELVLAAVRGESQKNELKVAYHLLLDAKRHKQRIADVVMAMQDSSRTPVQSPRFLGSSHTNSPSMVRALSVRHGKEMACHR